MKTGAELIAQERFEQIAKHDRTLDDDAKNNEDQQLALGAMMLLAVEWEEGIDSESYPEGWDKEICREMLSKPYKERLIIAGALIAAEIDRIQNTPHF